jgi:hypothetical protein
MAVKVELRIKVGNVYHPALSIPVDACQHFSVHPLTWLRYLGFTISGNEGHVSTLPDGPEVDHLQANIPPGNYYYVSQDLYLLDPDLMDDRTSDASDISSSRGNFRDRVVARDGTCVMTGATGFQACHIIPHAKGPQYLINLSKHRHEAVSPPLDDINDTRNGILLAFQLHAPFGASQIAFLQVSSLTQLSSIWSN